MGIKKNPYNKNKHFNKNKDSKGNFRESQDWEWYATDEVAANNMANLTWSDIVGSLIDGTSSDVVPGNLIIPYSHAIGSYLENRGDYATRSADTYYQYYTQGFASDPDFEAPDLLFTALAGASLIALMMEGKRMFGTLNHFNQYNAYWQKAIITSLGFNYESFTKEHTKADFCSEFNIRVDQINELIAVPEKLGIAHRWAFLASNIFSDNDMFDYNTVATYVLNGVLQYDGTSVPTGTALKRLPIRIDNDPLSFEEFFEYVDALLTPLTKTDPRSMFGALKRVYSESDLIKLSHLEIPYENAVVRNDVVSLALHNAMFIDELISSYNITGFNAIDSYESGDIFMAIQTPEGKILSHLLGSAIAYTADSDEVPLLGINSPAFLDTFGADVSAKIVLDLTSGMQFLSTSIDKTKDVAEFNHDYAAVVVRSEVLFTPILMTLSPTLGVVIQSKVSPYLLDLVGDGSNCNLSVNPLLVQLTHINSHPYILNLRAVPYDSDTGTAYTAQVHSRIGEIDRYTTVAYDRLRTLHSRTFYKLLEFPRNTKSIT